MAGVRDALAEGAAVVAAAAGTAEAAVTTAVVEKCVEVLKQMRGITATYRMTNKPLPTRHSHFVPSVLAPLKPFVSGPAAELLGPTVRDRLAHKVAEQVTERYSAMAEELVTTVRKTESSLKRLKGRKGGAGPNTQGASDTDKICHQLRLDVAEYQQQLPALELDPQRLPALAGLLQLVAPDARPEE